jgi:NAD(P)-dependent dehydrogenase (short-subunit alcohol dehydrogenase family)
MSRSVLVTGAADSVARTIAERFAARGDRVHICDRNASALASMLSDNPQITGTAADVACVEQIERVMEEAVQAHGAPEILINTVGIAGPRANIEDVDAATWNTVMAANVGAMFHFTRLVVPSMKDAHRGVIINFSSASTRTGLPLRTPYIVSKFAVEGLTKNLARELGSSGIRCNAILPGMIDNRRVRDLIASAAEAEGLHEHEVRRRYLDYISMRTSIDPKDIADTVVFLASDAARHITGQLLGVCGGLEWEV